MMTFREAVDASFTRTADGRLFYQFGPEVAVASGTKPQYELNLEPMLGGGYFLALYENYPGSHYPELMWEDKVPVVPLTPKLQAIFGGAIGGK